TPLYFAVQVMDETSLEDARRVKKTAWDTVEFISKVLQSLQKIITSEQLKLVKEGVYKNIMFDIEKELNQLLEKNR
ncbi:MAG: hypothetical protein D6748_04725, partial [Calditrichaeota bacterium]